MTVQLILGDCLQVMQTLPAGSVDAIITDLPYGTTQAAFDEIIPFAPMWEQVKRVLKPNGVFVTTASQPFTSKLIMSNFDWFRYEWIWDKHLPTGFLDANRKPLKRHENVLVFSQRGTTTYNPQKWADKPYIKGASSRTSIYGSFEMREKVINETGERYPTSIIDISNADRNKDGHPTQKPVALYEYLILTYTHPGETVMDFCCGSGTTGIAAHLTGRNAILIEKREDYYQIAQRRIEQAQAQPALPMEV